MVLILKVLHSLIYVIGKVAKFKHLKGGVDFVSSVPKSPSGKIMRKNLRAALNKSKI